MTESPTISDHNNDCEYKEREETIEQGLKRCSKCGEIQPLNDFWIVRDPKKSRDGHYSRCKDCGKEDNLKKYDESFIENLVYGCKKRAAQNHDERCDITKELVLRMLEEQTWRCKYSKILMTLNHHDPHAVSVDRKNPDLPYIEANVALCSKTINLIKSDRSYEALTDESHAVVMNALPLDSPYLRKRQNDGISARTKGIGNDSQKGINETNVIIS